MLHRGVCVPRRGFSREAAIYSPDRRKSRHELPLLAHAHRNGKNPLENFSVAVVRHQIRLRLDRCPLKGVASAR